MTEQTIADFFLKESCKVFTIIDDDMAVSDLAKKSGKDETNIITLIKQLRKIKLLKRKKIIFAKKRKIKMTRMGISIQDELKKLMEALSETKR